MATEKSAEQPERSEAAIARNTVPIEKSAEQPERSEAAIARQNCDLCEAARFTHWYHEDDICWIADCEVCSVPMVVWKPHGIHPSDAEVEHMLEQLAAAGATRFGDEPFELDRAMRTIPDHWHAHARDSDWFRLRMARPLSRFSGVGADRVER